MPPTEAPTEPSLEPPAASSTELLAPECGKGELCIASTDSDCLNFFPFKAIVECLDLWGAPQVSYPGGLPSLPGFRERVERVNCRSWIVAVAGGRAVLAMWGLVWRANVVGGTSVTFPCRVTTAVMAFIKANAL